MHVPKLRQVSGLEAFQDDRNRRLATRVLTDLKAARAPALKSILDLNSNSEDDRVGGFRFSSGSQAEPQKAIEWAYLLSSAVVALARACFASLLAPERLSDYLAPSDIDRLIEWVTTCAANHEESSDSFRVALFSGFALLQFRELFEAGDLEMRSTHVENGGPLLAARVGGFTATGPRWRKLRRALKKAARRVIRNHEHQSDLHHPYTFCVDEDHPYDDDSYRQDHLVVQTTPIALWLVARLDSHAMFDHRFEGSATAVSDCFKPHEPPRVAPGQSSTYNGTVNMNYLHEAVGEVRRIARQSASERRLWRLGAVVRAPRTSFRHAINNPALALVVAFTLFILSPLPALLWNSILGIGSHADSHSTKVIVRHAPRDANSLSHQSPSAVDDTVTANHPSRKQADQSVHKSSK
jgi:hypothetical protein